MNVYANNTTPADEPIFYGSFSSIEEAIACAARQGLAIEGKPDAYSCWWDDSEEG